MWQKADSAAYDALRKKEIEGELRPVDMLNCMKKQVYFRFIVIQISNVRM